MGKDKKDKKDKKHKKDKKDKKGRLTGVENEWDDLSKESCKWVACFCFEAGCTGCLDPFHFGMFKVLCCKGDSDTDNEYMGEKGCLSSISKVLCLVSGLSMPCVCTICNADLVSSPYRIPDEADDAWVANAFWCCYCGCAGYGCAAPMEPMVHAETKICCLESQFQTADACGDGGCYHTRSKCCCFLSAVELPPTSDIGMACCGQRIIGGKPDTRGTRVEELGLELGS